MMDRLLQANDVATNVTFLLAALWVCVRVWPSACTRAMAGRLDEPSCFIYFAWIVSASTVGTRLYWLPWYLLPADNPYRDFLGSNAFILQPVIALTVFGHLFCLYALNGDEPFREWFWRPAATIAGCWVATFAATILLA